MKLATALLAALFASGCGGYLTVHTRTEDLAPYPVPVPVPAPHRACSDIGTQEAAGIAVTEGSHRHCSSLSVDRVECEKRHCNVLLRGYVEGRRARIRVKVDRATGEILSYKCKRDHDDDDHEDD